MTLGAESSYSCGGSSMSMLQDRESEGCSNPVVVLAGVATCHCACKVQPETFPIPKSIFPFKNVRFPV